jgi:predicted HAD superfamily hydrolase
MKKISVLLYLEPWTENKKPWFRHFPIRSIFNKIANAVKAQGGTVNLVCGEGAHFRILESGWGFSAYDKVFVLAEKKLRKISKNYSDFSTKDQTSPQELGAEMAQSFPEITKTKYDLVISWESSTNYLKTVLETSRIFHFSPGLLSRDPYPYHITVDPQGIFSESWLNKFDEPHQISKGKAHPRISAIDYLLESTGHIHEYRAKTIVPPELKLRLKNYRKNYCVPLQISDYFATTNKITGPKQWDFLMSVLEATPSDVGIVVTHYISPGLEERIILPDNINYLSTRFPNLIYSEQLDNISSASQAILPLVDGVITISSSVGLQAKLLGKELITVGESHLSKFSDGGLCDIGKDNPVSKNSSRYLKELHGRYFLPTDLIFKNQKSIWDFITRLVTQKSSRLPDFFDQEELSIYYEEKASELSKNFTRELKSNLGEASVHASILLERLSSNNYSTVSFDIFDTLVQREVYSPAAVFDIVAHKALKSEMRSAFKIMLRESSFANYRELRMASEREARADLQGLNFEDCNYDEIFSHLHKYSKNEALTEFLKKCELDCEIDVIQPRAHGKLLYELARSAGHKVIFTSDMYLPESAIQRILAKCDIYDGEKIYVSSEIRLRKHSGTLFLFILRDLQLRPDELFHIGDAIHGDYTVPKRFGISCSLVPAARDLWMETYGPSYRKRGADNLTEEVIFGGQAMNVYDFPYYADEKPTFFRGRPELFGYSVAGPLLTNLAEWIRETVNKRKIDRLFFFARDGFIVKNVYEKISDQYKGLDRYEYVNVSRRVLAIAAISDYEDILLLTKQRFEAAPLEDFIRIRFGFDLSELTIDELNEVLSGTNIKSPAEIINTRTHLTDLILVAQRLAERIFLVAEEMRVKVKRYFKEIGLEPHQDRNIAIFDIGYSASLQRYIEKIYKSNFIDGLYFATFVGIKALFEQGGKASGYAGENIDPSLTRHQYVHAVHIFETIFSHTVGSTFNYMEDEHETIAVLTSEQLSSGKNHFVSQLWTGVEKFLETYKKYQEYIDWTQFNWERALKPFDSFVESPNVFDLYMLDDVKFENLYCGEPAYPILSFDAPHEFSLWGHGQRTLQNILTNSNRQAVADLAVAKNFENLNEYLSMLYEEQFIKNLIKNHKAEVSGLNETIKSLEKREVYLQSAIDKISNPNHMDREYVMKMGSISEEALLKDIERWFSAEKYLEANPDVAKAVEAGIIPSALAHYRFYGLSEGRKISL